MTSYPHRWNPFIPALRWSEGRGYGLDDARVQRWMDASATGFILFGGTAESAHAAAEELQERAGRPLLLGADLERGVGQQFAGATPLPPPAALAAIDDLEVTRRAGELTGLEAVRLGVPWVFAPVGDLDVEPDNPIVGTRSFGSDPMSTGRQVAAWIEGCLSSGAIPCVKHFPGHGHTTEDSHEALPVVTADSETLRAQDLAPFRAALEVGVPSVMTAHVAYPSLDPAAGPATRSGPILQDLLRAEMGFGGVVVTDAMIMDGAGSGDEALIEAMAAGVDLLLYPPDDFDVDRALDRVVGSVSPARKAATEGRVAVLWSRVRRTVPLEGPFQPDLATALGWARRSLRTFGSGVDANVSGDSVNGAPVPSGNALGADRGAHGSHPAVVTVIDDDLGGPYPPPSREPFLEELRRGGSVSVDRAGASPSSDEATALRILAVFAEPRGWKGRAGLSAESREAVHHWAAATAAHPRLIVVFGGPRVLTEIPAGTPRLLAWGGDPLMQRAAAGAIRDGARPVASAP